MFLAQEGFDYYGVDGSHEFVEIATERLKQAGYDTSTIQQSTFEKLPYEDNFDAVIDRGSITCNRKAEVPALVDEAKRVLKPGGYLFSTFLNMQFLRQGCGRSVGRWRLYQLRWTSYQRRRAALHHVG